MEEEKQEGKKKQKSKSKKQKSYARKKESKQAMSDEEAKQSDEGHGKRQTGVLTFPNDPKAMCSIPDYCCRHARTPRTLVITPC